MPTGALAMDGGKRSLPMPNLDTLSRRVFIGVKVLVLVLLVGSAAIHGHPVGECMTEILSIPIA